MSQLSREPLIEALPGGSRNDQAWRVPLCDKEIQRLLPRLRLHHHPCAAAERGVVHRPVPVVGEVAQVVDPQVQQSVAAGLADE